MMDIFHGTIDNLPNPHPLRTILMQSYPDIETWFAKISKEKRSCSYLMNGQDIVGIAITAQRQEGHVKLCSFCTTLKGHGSAFLQAILQQERDKANKFLYGDALASNPHVLSFFQANGFHVYPHPTKKNSMALCYNLSSLSNQKASFL